MAAGNDVGIQAGTPSVDSVEQPSDSCEIEQV